MSVSAFHRGGEGEPLVLLHGFTNCWRAWTPVLPALEARHEVFAPTLPGHLGGPSFGEEPVSVEAMVASVAAQLDDHGIDRAHIVGNSLGGWLALELALRGRALSVVGLCPAGGWETGSREERAVYRYFWRASRIALPLSKPFFKALVTYPRLRAMTMRDMVARPQRMDAALALSTLEAASNCAITGELLAISKRGELFGELGPIECPVTIAMASEDRLFKGPLYFAKFRRLLPHVNWVELDGMGHLAMSDDPSLVSRVILDATAGEGGG
jgi:pimeloyl-ACP methyl ester carboxylesterase